MSKHKEYGSFSMSFNSDRTPDFTVVISDTYDDEYELIFSFTDKKIEPFTETMKKTRFYSLNHKQSGNPFIEWAIGKVK